ncbi:unnamed protein product [Kuraishia capsulata CBS 1993]|uniref:Bms1-type G domain-containing protein n=1 Tax=Kuraishia capsulata CBS 1993 TaxID=1382522 RepID=W6MFG7_9ASCO|nr:uncharacterized protein KUCA_T00000504001 [Kuraishia capsulata CBS 1993]CDK24539.1 unnamed protein product [Kuraishia capsulata CBS 1993]
METQQSNKAHRGGTTRQGAKKKLHSQGHNAKAFAVAAPRKLERMAKRTSEMNEKKLHVPMVDRTPDDDPPPVIIAVVGPPGTGKSTLIKSLVRRLTKTTLSEIKGPVTVVSGKRRRLTFIEVSNDLNSMIDIAKIADLVLMLMDGNFGFEMETMEFLNILQHHGMPRVLGVTTHLDLFKSQSTLRASKKRLKQRFWTEVYAGAKLFYLSGVINGRYPDREILNLTRFISVMKFRPLKWRNEHPYMLADRVVDLTHPLLIEQNPKVDRKIAIYGYLHGTPLSANSKVHIAGVGDYEIAAVEKLPDPCPTPYFEQRLEEIEREAEKTAAANGEIAPSRRGRRKRLEDKQKIIYAPMSDAHGLLIDKDAVYIDIGDKESFKVDGEPLGLGEKMVTDLQVAAQSMEENLVSSSGLQLFSSSKALNDVESEEEEDEEEEEDNGDRGRTSLRHAKVHEDVHSKITDLGDDDEDEDGEDGFDEEESGYEKRKVIDFNFNDNYNIGDEELQYASESEIGDADDFGETKWQSIGAKLTKNTAKKVWDINKLIYLNNIDPADVIKRWRQEEEDSESEDIEDIEEDFFQKKDDHKVQAETERKHDLETLDKLQEKWSTDHIKSIRSRFMKTPRQRLEDEAEEDDDGNVYGDFEDLEDETESATENGTNTDSENGSDASGNEDEDENESGDDFADFDEEEGSKPPKEDDYTVEELRELNAKKKEKLRQQFEEEEGGLGKQDPEGEEDTWYELQKAKMAKQNEINKAEYDGLDEKERTRIEGFRSGSYVRITFSKLPMEFMENFDPHFPIVIGGLLQTEERFGFLNVRIRRHRWHKKILKSNDPLVLSLGWRRFQTLPVYTTTDSRTRNRMLKYTPEHAYCFASFYGPLVAPNTTFCAVQNVANSQTTNGFRIAATGIVEDLDANAEIVKKLKLVGHPYKVFRNTAFIKDMFNSALEVAKFEGASIKTVSGIRGEIKRALSKPEGHFRATFEDKILMSDVIIMRTWYPVQVRKFYNPVTSLLMEAKTEWKGMRLTGQIRAENNVSTPMNPDSAYKKIERVERRFNALRVPKSIQSELPFKSQISAMKPQNKKTYMQKRAVILNGEEKDARRVIQTISTIKNAKEKKNREKKHEKNQERIKKISKQNEFRQEKERERKKEYFAKQGQKRGMGASASNGDAFGSAKKRRS